MESAENKDEEKLSEYKDAYSVLNSIITELADEDLESIGDISEFMDNLMEEKLTYIIED
jgi:hypothetical protein